MIEMLAMATTTKAARDWASRRGKPVQILVTPEERKAFDAAAAKAELGTSTWLRQLARARAGLPRLEPAQDRRTPVVRHTERGPLQIVLDEGERHVMEAEAARVNLKIAQWLDYCGRVAVGLEVFRP